MKEFFEYLKSGTIRRSSPDINRSLSMKDEAIRKLSSLNERIEKIGIRDDNANEYVEQSYDIIMFLIRSKLYKEGYSSSGLGAHEAEVSYLKELSFNENQIEFIDKLRYFRNGILYYGKRFDSVYAKKVIKFLKEIYPKLVNLINN